jgi:hypothetical protein
MSIKVTKVQVWAGEINDRPGGLASALGKIAQAGGSVECVIARRQPDKPGTGVVYLTPIAGKKRQDAALAAGLSSAGNITTLRVEGSDKAGLGAKIAKAIADTGVNLRGVSAIVCGNQFVAYLGFDDPTAAAIAAKAIKGVK